MYMQKKIKFRINSTVLITHYSALHILLNNKNNYITD